MIEKELTILNNTGFHTRPASEFAKLASQFQSKVTLRKDHHEADGKNVISLIALGVAKGHKVRLIVEGPDEKQAIQELCSLIKNKFGEE